MKLVYQQEETQKNKVYQPEYAHPGDSGMDIYCPFDIAIPAKSRVTFPLNVKFKITIPFIFKILNLFGAGLGVELQVRPKSGRSKSGIEVSLGTIDQGYRNFCGATIHNFNDKIIQIQQNEKICQIVVVPVFNKVKLISGIVNVDTERGLGGFGSTSLHKK